MVKREKIGLIAVDYIQLVKGRGESRYEQTTDVSNTLRELAKDTGVPVLAVSQLSKPERGEKRPPRIFDMKESGALEQDAHVILLPYRPQEKDGHYTHKDIIIIGKQREGPTGSIKAPFDSKTLTFQGEQEDATFEELF
jgi:replicative DNA helicase